MKAKRISGRALAACAAAVALVALVALLAQHPWDAGAPAEDGEQPAEVEKGDTEGDGGQDAGDPWSWEPAYVPEGGEPGEVPVMPDNYLPPDDPALWPMPAVEYADDGEGNRIGKGRVTVYFWKSAGVDRAREIVDELGYTWLGGLMLAEGIEDFEVEVMVPEGQEREAKERFKALPEVSMANLYVSVPMTVMEVSSEVSGGADVAAGSSSRGVIAASEQQKFHLHAARFVRAWDTVKCEGKVTVAVLDSGKPKKALSDLELNVDYDRAYDAVTGTLQWGTDSVGHGTMVAGVISAIADNGAGTDGASYNAKILPVRVTINEVDSEEGGSDEGDSEKVEKGNPKYLAKALEYLETLDDVPEAVNISVGFYEGANGFNDDVRDVISRISASIERLRQRGVVIVASAGNKTKKLVDGELVLVDHVFYPACLPGVLSVGALSAPSAEDVELILSEGGYPNASIADFSSVLSDADIVAYGEGIWVLDPPSL